MKFAGELLCWTSCVAYGQHHRNGMARIVDGSKNADRHIKGTCFYWPSAVANVVNDSWLEAHLRGQ